MPEWNKSKEKKISKIIIIMTKRCWINWGLNDERACSQSEAYVMKQDVSYTIIEQTLTTCSKIQALDILERPYLRLKAFPENKNKRQELFES